MDENNMKECIKLYYMSRLFEIGAFILLAIGSTSASVKLLEFFIVCENVLFEIHHLKSGLVSISVNIHISKMKKYIPLICFIFALAMTIIGVRVNFYFMIAVLLFSFVGHIECTICDIFNSSQTKE